FIAAPPEKSSHSTVGRGSPACSTCFSMSSCSRITIIGRYPRPGCSASRTVDVSACAVAGAPTATTAAATRPSTPLHAGVKLFLVDTILSILPSYVRSTRRRSLSQAEPAVDTRGTLESPGTPRSICVTVAYLSKRRDANRFETERLARGEEA